MELKKLLQNLDYHILQGSIEKEIQAIEYDSRKAGADTMFVCIKLLLDKKQKGKWKSLTSIQILFLLAVVVAAIFPVWRFPFCKIN